jgi:hypothetical protein
VIGADDDFATGALVGNLLLVRARADQVSSWVGKGLVAAHVTPLGDWSAVTPARIAANTAAPYDDARTTIAARPLAAALRPAIGFFVHGRRGVVVVSPPGWRAVKRWLIWAPGEGAVRAPRLANARPADLVAVSGLAASGLPHVVAAVNSAHAGPLAWVSAVHAALRLPGHSLLVEADAPRGSLVEPSPKRVAAFDKMAREEAAHRAEVDPPSPRDRRPS